MSRPPEFRFSEGVGDPGLELKRPRPLFGEKVGVRVGGDAGWAVWWIPPTVLVLAPSRPFRCRARDVFDRRIRFSQHSLVPP